jgi:hypothetical protein
MPTKLELNLILYLMGISILIPKNSVCGSMGSLFLADDFLQILYSFSEYVHYSAP